MPASKILVALYTCHEYVYKSEYMVDWFTRPVEARLPALKDTWLKDVEADGCIYAFGQPPKRLERDPKDAEIFLQCPDDYYHLCRKTRALARFALDNGYDRLLKVDDDVYVHWDRMVKSGHLDNAAGEYIGGGLEDHPYAFGAAYWLGSQALDIIATSSIGDSEWAEDKWVGRCLERKGIQLTYDPRYYVEIKNQTHVNQYVSRDILRSHAHEYITLHALSPTMMRNYDALSTRTQ
jgi:hypothetical protein